MRKIKKLVAICFTAVLIAGLVFNTAAVEYAVEAEAVEISKDAQEGVQQGNGSQDIQQPDTGNGNSGDSGGEGSGEGGSADVEEPGIHVNGALYTGYYMDNDGIMYMVTSGDRGRAVTGVIAKGASYYNAKTAKSVTFAVENIYVSGKVYSGYYLDKAGKLYKASKGTAKTVSYTVAKGQKYYNERDGKTLTLSKNTVYINGKVYSGYYLDSNGKMHKVSSGTAKAVSYTVAKGQKYYSYKDGKTLTLSNNTV